MFFYFLFHSSPITVDKPQIETDNTGSNSGEGNEIDLDQTNNGDTTGTDKPDSGIDRGHQPNRNGVFIMDNSDDRTTSFFAQPGILAGMIIFHFFFNRFN